MLWNRDSRLWQEYPAHQPWSCGPKSTENETPVSYDECHQRNVWQAIALKINGSDEVQHLHFLSIHPSIYPEI